MASAGEHDRRLRVNIVSWESGGLGTDIEILTETFERLGCEVRFKGRRSRKPRGRAHSMLMTGLLIAAQRFSALTKHPSFDVNIFIERVFPEFLPQARVNCLFVNPEWFREENEARLSAIDWVLCKTPSAADCFAGVAAPRRMVHFSSNDKRIPGRQRNGPLRCLHISGASEVKGSEAVVEVWARHPEWPELVVVRRRRYGGADAPPLATLPNVRYETEYLSHETLMRLQNDCEVHLIPSEAEGYGHVIGEGMSCGAVVVTTDAPPMNELVSPDRGVLVRVARSEPMRRSRRNFVDLDDLDRKLAAVFAMSPAERAAMGANARAWYEAQALRFEDSMRTFLDEVRAGAGGRTARPTVGA